MKFLKDYWGLALAIGCFIAYVLYAKSKAKKSLESDQFAANEKPNGIPDPIERPRPDIDDFGEHPSVEIKPMPPINTTQIKPTPPISVRPPVEDRARPAVENNNITDLSSTRETEVERTPAKFAVSRSVYDLR